MTPWPLFVRRSASMGALCLLAAALAVLATSFLVLVFQPQILDETFAPSRAEQIRRGGVAFVMLLIAVAVIVAPLAETLIFPLFYWVVSPFPGRRAAFIVLIAVIAFFAHGAAFINVAQAASFGVMASYYDRLRREDSRPRAYWGVVIAHAVYNGMISSVLALGFFISAFV
jgi:hypothetical protein